MQEQVVPNAVKNHFCSERNAAISKVLSDFLPQLKLLSRILRLKIFQLLGDHLASNADEITMLRKHLTDLTHRVYLDIIGSVEHRQELCSLFQVEDLSEAQLSIGSVLCMDAYEFFMHYLADRVSHRHETQQASMNVSHMAAEGLTKLKHVGGWAIRKELERCRRYIRQHLYSQSSETRQSVQIAHPKGEPLEQNAIIQFS